MELLFRNPKWYLKRPCSLVAWVRWYFRILYRRIIPQITIRKQLVCYGSYVTIGDCTQAEWDSQPETAHAMLLNDNYELSLKLLAEESVEGIEEKCLLIMWRQVIGGKQ